MSGSRGRENEKLEGRANSRQNFIMDVSSEKRMFSFQERGMKTLVVTGKSQSRIILQDLPTRRKNGGGIKGFDQGWSKMGSYGRGMQLGELQPAGENRGKEFWGMRRKPGGGRGQRHREKRGGD